MTRDDDYFRELLLEAEASNEPYIEADILCGLNEDAMRAAERRHMHAVWLCDAGLFKHHGDGAFRITNQGHDYLAAIRSDTVWNKTKAAAAKAGGLPLGLMKELAIGFAKQELAKLGLPIG